MTNKSIAKRLDRKIEDLHELEDNEEVWKLVGYYLA